MSFWHSDLGEITGSSLDSFTKSFERIPNNTYLIAEIAKIVNGVTRIEGVEEDLIKITWCVSKGDFKGQTINQNLYVYSAKPETRHRSLNMLKLLYEMFHVKHSQNAPTDVELFAFVGKSAGLRIQETKPNAKGSQFNYVSEVHPVLGFQPCIGTPLVVPVVTKEPSRVVPFELDDNVPF